MAYSSNKGIILWVFLSIAIAIAYIFAGIYLIFFGDELQMVKLHWRVTLGILFVAYGIFRTFRSIKKYQTTSSGEEM